MYPCYERIRTLRKEAKISQQKIADDLSMHRTTYVRYESGGREIPMNIAILIADYYNVSLDYLVGRTDVREVAKCTTNA